MAERKQYPTPEHWHGGRTPNGDTNDFNEYYYAWKDLGDAIEGLTGLQVSGYNPGLSLCTIKDGKYVNGGSLQLPTWFAKLLVERCQLKEQYATPQLPQKNNTSCEFTD